MSAPSVPVAAAEAATAAASSADVSPAAAASSASVSSSAAAAAAASIAQDLTLAPALSTRFAGYNVVVTGAASGIGLSTVVEFLREGACVAMLDISEDRGVELAAHFQSQGARAFFYRCDVRDQSACKAAVDRFAADQCGSEGIHTLFNNAATFLCKGLDASTADFQHALMTNVAGYAHMVQAVHPHMLVAQSRRKGLCSIVNNSSTSASRPQMSHWTYSSSKGGIKQLSRCMALDFGGAGIRVNSISPSWTWSPEVMKAAKQGGKEKWDPIWGKFHMLGRCGEMREVSRVVLFLASPDASFITASDIPIDGGYQQMTGERLGEESSFAGSE